MHELRGAAEPGFAELVKRISPCDLLLVEGFKREQIPKLEVYRAPVGEPLIHPHDRTSSAIASDARARHAPAAVRSEAPASDRGVHAAALSV